MYKALYDQKFVYDTSMFTGSVWEGSDPIWPFTLDYSIPEVGLHIMSAVASAVFNCINDTTINYNVRSSTARHAEPTALYKEH